MEKSKEKPVGGLENATAKLGHQLAEAPKWVSRALEMSQHCAARMVRLRATGMAAELTYRTLFALIPLTVLGLVLFRVVGGLDKVQARVEDQLFSFFGVPDIHYPELPSPTATEPHATIEGAGDGDEEASDANTTTQKSQLSAPPTEPGDRVALIEAIGSSNEASANGPGTTEQNIEQQKKVQASIRRTLAGLTEKVTNLDFASLGIVGLLLFLYAAVGLTDSVEADFNLVCESERDRPLHLRMAIHWSILTIGSGLLAMSLYAADRIVDWVGGHGGEGIMQAILGRALGFIAGWVLLFLMYALMPNTRINLRAAVIGSLIAALLWEIAKRSFSVYVAATQPYANLYGSLGLIPVFLFWIYITWLIVLFGLFLTYSWQAYPDHPPTPEEDRQAANIVPNSMWSVTALVEIAAAFYEDRTMDLPSLTQRLHLPPSVVRLLTERLESAGYVLRVIHPTGEHYSLARPAERIKMADVIRELGETPGLEPPEDSAGWTAFRHIQRRYQDVAGTFTLADLVKA